MDRHFVFGREEDGACQVFGGLRLDGAAVAAGGGGAGGMSVCVQEDVVEEGVFVVVGNVVVFDDGRMKFAEFLVVFGWVRFRCL